MRLTLLLHVLLMIIPLENTYAQTSIPTEIENQERNRLNLKRQKEPSILKNKDIFLQPNRAKPEKRAIPNKETACLPIKKVSLIEDHYLGLSPDFLSEAEGKCIGVSDIKNLVSDLNKFYQSQGFITTRVYVPEQNLADGILELRVRPGIVSGFAYNTGAPPDNRILFAFPIDPGDIANLRDLEQGLENFNAPRSQSGKFKLQPGEKPGETIILIDEKRSLPVSVNTTYSNSGSKSRGPHNLTTDFTLDNLFNANDQLELSHNRLLPFDHTGKSKGFFAQFTLPYKYWQFRGNFTYSDYEIPLKNLNNPLDLSGYNLGYRAEIRRNLWRDKSTKVNATIALNGSRSRSFLEDTELKTQRRYYSFYDIGVGMSHQIDQMSIAADITYQQGVHWLGSQKALGRSFDSQFRLFSADLSLYTPLLDNKAQLQTRLRGQWTKAKLPSGQRFYIGGRGSVRGFRENYLNGRQGLTWNTDLTIPLYKTNWVSVSGKVGLDFGLVDPDPGAGLSDNKIAGASLGVRVNLNDMLDIEAAYERPLYRPDQFSESPDIFYLSAQFGLSQTVTEIADFIESLD